MVRSATGRALAVVATAALICLSVALEAPPAAADPGSYVVQSTGDQVDAIPGDGACLTAVNTCTLRAALTEAKLDGRASSISFAIGGTGVHRIVLGSALPPLTDDAGGTTINGYTEPGAKMNTDAVVDNAVLRVEIRGMGSTGFDALVISSSNNVVRGLAFYRLRRAVLMTAGGNNNVVVGNFIGTNAAATLKDTVKNLNSHGVAIEKGASRNQIGRPGAADRNVISGNAGRAVYLLDAVLDNMIQNNIIGLAPNGRTKLPNADMGIDVNAGATRTVIGGTAAQAGNLISGNDGYGVEISHAPKSPTADNKIIGNRIGTDPSGRSGPAYARNGDRFAQGNVHTEDHVTRTLIAYNTIGNSQFGGIKVDSGSSGTDIHGNRIGISSNGTRIPNGPYGVQIELGSNGTVVGPNNVIAYNRSGIRLLNNATVANTITHNSIFADDRLGIDIAPLDVVNGSSVVTATNRGIHFPVISRATSTSVSGLTCARCRVEIFLSDSSSTNRFVEAAYGEGRTYLGASNASSSGAFNVHIPNSSKLRVVTATATSSSKNTSEFSRNFDVPGPK